MASCAWARKSPAALRKAGQEDPLVARCLQGDGVVRRPGQGLGVAGASDQPGLPGEVGRLLRWSQDGLGEVDGLELGGQLLAVRVDAADACLRHIDDPVAVGLAVDAVEIERLAGAVRLAAERHGDEDTQTHASLSIGVSSFMRGSPADSS